MKKMQWLALIVLLSGGTAALFPCDVGFETTRLVENGKNKISVKIVVDKVHKRCPVGIEKTRLLVSGVRIEKQSAWTNVGGTTYQSELTVTLNQGEKGEIRVVRECPKTGTQEGVLKLEPH